MMRVSQLCPWKYKCYRYIATPGSYQSYADFLSEECKDGYKKYIPEKEDK